MVNYEEIESWKEEAKKKGATHIISVCDTFSYEYSPVYVMKNEDVEERKKELDGIGMQIIHEIIKIKE